MRILITGAAGRIGKQVAEELSDYHDLCLIDLRRVRDHRSITADLARTLSNRPWINWFGSKSARWSDAFKGTDVVVHLAADSNPGSAWESILPNNIQGTWNVIQAAAEYRVRRVVFASSNWAVKAHEQKLAPDCYGPEGPKMDSTIPPSPLTAYGLSKGFGELAGRMFVDQGNLESFVAVRVGNYQPKPSKDEIVRARWIGVHDIRALFRRCVEADLQGFHVVYGVSAQTAAPYDLTQTVQTLSWFPRQCAESEELIHCTG